MLRTYEDMVEACLASDKPVHLLYFFMQVSPMPTGEQGRGLFPDQDLTGIDSICTLLFDAHEPAMPGLTFTRLVKIGDSKNATWDIVAVMTLRSNDGQPVTFEQGQDTLEQLRGRIMSGDIPRGVPVFDRTGQAKSFDRATPLGDLPERMN